MRAMWISDFEEQLETIKEQYGNIEIRIEGAYVEGEWPIFVHKRNTQNRNTTLIIKDEYISIEKSTT